MEGDSDVIDEEAELSLGDNTIRKTMKKGPKSLDDYENEDSVNQSDFIKGVMADNNLAGDSRLSAR